MAAPIIPYIISGRVRKGPRGGYAESEFTATSADGFQDVNLFLDAGTALATSQTVTIWNLSTNQSATAVTNSEGDYNYDLANLGYTDGDSIRVYAENIDATRKIEWAGADTDSIRENVPAADGRITRVIMPGRLGKEYTEEYPLPVSAMNLIINNENPRFENTYTNGQITRQVAYFKGKVYMKSFTWSGGNLTEESAWEEI